MSRDLVREIETSPWFLPVRIATALGRGLHATQEEKDTAPEGAEPGLSGIDIGKDRHFVAIDPERCSEPVRSFDSFTRDLEAMAGLVVVVRGEKSGAGIDLGVLDPGLRGAGAGRVRGDAGAAPHDEADRRAQERCARLPVDLAASVLRPSAGRFPSGRCDLSASFLRAPGKAADRRPLALRAAHAEGAGPDECPVGLGAHRHHGPDRAEDPAGDHRRRARPAASGVVPAPSGQGQCRHNCRKPGGHLARRAPVCPGAGHAALRLPRTAAGGLRGTDHRADRQPDAAGRFHRR